MNKEQQQELFNYLYNELGVTALESNLNDIEDIINPRIFPYVDSDKPAPRKLTEEPNSISNESLYGNSKTYGLEYKDGEIRNKMAECFFVPSKKTSSATICENCGLEKSLHTIGEGIKSTKTVIISNESIDDVKEK